MFGWKTLRDDDEEIVLTSNELDAVVIGNSTQKSAIALPCGDTNLPQEVKTRPNIDI